MSQPDGLRRLTAFTAASLVVVWTCGSFFTALFKLGYRLTLGVWPDTLVYGLVPAAWTPGELILLQNNEALAALWTFLLSRDVLTWLLVLPPVLLLPCLLLLRGDHGGMLPALRSTTRPFGPGQADQPRSMAFPCRPGFAACSTKNRA